MLTDENIRFAIKLAAKNKRKNNMRHRRLRYIKAHTDQYVPIVRSWILDFKPPNHRTIMINDGISAKKRKIIVPTVREILVQHAIVGVLRPIVSSGMYKHSYASIPGRGLHSGARVCQKWIRHHPRQTKYCLKIDIRKFFESIDQDVLLAKLRKIIRDDRYFKCVEKVVRTTKSGVPLGFVTSQWFANYLLTDLDHYIKQDLEVSYYIRFMDDMVIFGSNKRKLHKIRRVITDYLDKELHLELKGNWQVFPIDKRFLDFLGFKFHRKHTGIRRRIALKAQRKAKRIYKKSRANIKDARQIVTCAGLLKYADCHKWFENHISKFVSIRQMRKKISNYDRRKNKCSRTRQKELPSPRR